MSNITSVGNSHYTPQISFLPSNFKFHKADIDYGIIKILLRHQLTYSNVNKVFVNNFKILPKQEMSARKRELNI